MYLVIFHHWWIRCYVSVWLTQWAGQTTRNQKAWLTKSCQSSTRGGEAIYIPKLCGQTSLMFYCLNENLCKFQHLEEKLISGAWSHRHVTLSHMFSCPHTFGHVMQSNNCGKIWLQSSASSTNKWSVVRMRNTSTAAEQHSTRWNFTHHIRTTNCRVCVWLSCDSQEVQWWWVGGEDSEYRINHLFFVFSRVRLQK